MANSIAMRPIDSGLLESCTLGSFHPPPPGRGGRGFNQQTYAWPTEKLQMSNCECQPEPTCIQFSDAHGEYPGDPLTHRIGRLRPRCGTSPVAISHSTMPKLRAQQNCNVSRKSTLDSILRACYMDRAAAARGDYRTPSCTTGHEEIKYANRRPPDARGHPATDAATDR
jgi:hypothetical protein